MCDFNNGFVLCKCSVQKVITHNKKSRRKKDKKESINEYIWTLYKYLGLSKDNERGRYMFPKNNIGKGLTSDFVLKELNDRNCFDFEYNPNEGDNLIINNTVSRNRIEFIFRNENWVEDHYSPFDHEYEKINNGEVEKIDLLKTEK